MLLFKSDIKLYLVLKNILLLFGLSKICCLSTRRDNYDYNSLWAKITRDSQLSREPLEQDSSSNWMRLDFSEQLAKRSSQLAYMISPISKQLIELPLDLQPSSSSDIGMQETNTSFAQTPSDLGDCVTKKTPIELEREQFDPVSGELVRICRGLFEANRCQGYCNSSTRPSVLSSSGVKRVSCPNGSV